MTEKNELVLSNKLKHKNMRWMAWACLFAAFIYVGLMAWKPDLKHTFGVFLGFCGTVIGVYMTNSNVRDGWGNK